MMSKDCWYLASHSKMVEPFAMYSKGLQGPEIKAYNKCGYEYVDIPNIQGDTSAIASHRARIYSEHANVPVLAYAHDFTIHFGRTPPGKQENFSEYELKSIIEHARGKSARYSVSVAVFHSNLNGVATAHLDGHIVSDLEEGESWKTSPNGIGLSHRAPEEFGLSRIFIPDGYDIPYSELTAFRQFTISPRGVAMQRLLQTVPWAEKNDG